MLFLGCLLQQSRTWMVLVEDQDGPGFLFLYVFYIMILTFFAIVTHFHRKDCLQFLWVSLVTSLFPQHHAIPSFYLRNRKSESLVCILLCMCVNLLVLRSASSWAVWKGIDHLSNRLTISLSKKSCVLPVPRMSSWSLSCSSWLERCFTVSRRSFHLLLVNWDSVLLKLNY